MRQHHESWGRRRLFAPPLFVVASRPCGVAIQSRKHGARQHLRPCPPLGAWRQTGVKAQAIGPSRGGQTTGVHVLTDVLGRPAVIHLTPGHASDVPAAPAVLGWMLREANGT